MTIAAGIVFGFWIACAVSATLNLMLLPRLRRSERRTEGPLVSIIVPARNEERAIEASLRALLAQNYGSFEIVLVDDQSTDRTRETAIFAAEGDSRLTILDGETPPPGWLGKPWAHQQGAARARGELLLFVDADVRYEPEALGSAVAEIERSGAGLLSLMPAIGMRGFWEHVMMPQLALAAFSVLPTWLVNHVRWAKLAIGGGTGILIRRWVYEAAGGHERLRSSVIDDISLARIGAKIAPARVVLAEDLVSVRMYHGLREIVGGFTKNFYFVLGGNLVTAFAILLVSTLFHLAPYVWTAAALTELLRGATPSRAAILGALSLGLIHFSRLLVYIRFRYGIANALFAHALMVVLWVWVALRSTWRVGVRRQLGWRGRTYDARIKRFGA